MNPSALSSRHIYVRPFDPDDASSSLARIARRIPAGSVVFDVGIGSGGLGQYLSTAKSCVVDGVDCNEEALKLASSYYRALHLADLDQAPISAFAHPDKYDFIVCADVLEHLRYPSATLRQLLGMLRPMGRMLISVPNVAYSGLIGELLLGQFRYRPEGLLDETHLRFFTRPSLLEFLKDEGLHVWDVDPVLRPLHESEFQAPLHQLPPAIWRHVASQPDALTYQFVVEASLNPSETVSGGFGPATPAEATFGAQLYWRHTASPVFTEQESIIARGVIGQGEQSLVFPIPAIAGEYEGFRLDLADRPGYMRLYGIELREQGGRAVWSWDGRRESLAESMVRQVEFAEEKSLTSGVNVCLKGDDPCIEFRLTPLQLARLCGGGTLHLRASWPMSADYLVFARQSPTTERQAQLIASLQAECRALEQERDEFRGEREGLKAECERLASEREALMSERDALQAQHAEMVASQSWRVTRPLRALGKQAKMLHAAFSPAMKPPPQPTPQKDWMPDPVTDVIIPVYRGLHETRACIESVLAAGSSESREVIVIDDAGPDPELSSLLEDYARAGAITLLRNPENLGFVATANRGMGVHPQRDVVLLNSDTEVPAGWLARLRRAAYRDATIGTATPFSNNATICSYPTFCADNALPAGWSLSALDALFQQVNAGKTVDIPTAVGFCMYIRRDCLAQTGLFDVETYGRGYGEENDFCMRARANGWRHVLASDVFVFHAGAVSFGDSENTRKINAIDTLARIYPEYPELVHKYIARDPIRTLRYAVDAARLTATGRPVLLFITHDRGGGTDKHVHELAARFSDAAEVLCLKPDSGRALRLTWLRLGEALELFFEPEHEYEALLQVLRTFRVSHVHVHHTLGIHPRLFGLARDLGVSHDFTAHDFYPLCPQISLTTLADRYCGEPSEAGCDACLKTSPAPGGVDIRTWRQGHAMLLEGAMRLFVPSDSAAERFRRHFPEARIMVVPHPDLDEASAVRAPRAAPLAPSERLRIVVLGALSPIKGPNLLEACALDAKARDLPFDFHLIGYAYRNLTVYPRSRLRVHGAYDDSGLASLLAAANPHLVWFPAQWPETYSYTLSACLQAGLPVATTDLGAIPERLRGRAWSWVRPWQLSPAQWNDFFAEIREAHFLSGTTPVLPGTPPTRAPFVYPEDYLKALAPPPPRGLTPEPDAISLIETHAYFGSRPIHGRIALRARALKQLYRLRSTAALAWLAKRIPQAWQRRVKNYLLGH